MTRRADHVIGVLRRHNALASVQQIAEACQGVLDEVAVRTVIQRLEGLGYVRCSGDEVRLTELGQHV